MAETVHTLNLRQPLPSPCGTLGRVPHLVGHSKDGPGHFGGQPRVSKESGGGPGGEFTVGAPCCVGIHQTQFGSRAVVREAGRF